MILSAGATVAVLDGQALKLFHMGGDAANPKLTPVQHGAVDDDASGGSGGHHSSAANPDDRQTSEDGYVAGVAKMLNAQAQGGKIKSLLVIAAPKALGELRKHYHKSLTAILEGEIAKELTGASTGDLEKAIAAA